MNGSRTHVAKVTVTIETDAGEAHTLVVESPEPRGGNPAFIRQQFDTAMTEALERGRAVIEAAYGRQRVGS